MPSLLVAGMLLSAGATSASAEPRSPLITGERQSIINRVQLDDGGRCFNRCMIGLAHSGCQADPEGKRQNCCSSACTRQNNEYYR